MKVLFCDKCGYNTKIKYNIERHTSTCGGKISEDLNLLVDLLNNKITYIVKPEKEKGKINDYNPEQVFEVEIQQKQIVNCNDKIIPYRLVKTLFFNDKYPHLKNIKVANSLNGYCKIVENGKFKSVKIKSIIEDLYDFIPELLTNECLDNFVSHTKAETRKFKMELKDNLCFLTKKMVNLNLAHEY
jgi:hypothetical protein